MGRHIGLQGATQHLPAVLPTTPCLPASRLQDVWDGVSDRAAALAEQTPTGGMCSCNTSAIALRVCTVVAVPLAAVCCSPPPAATPTAMRCLAFKLPAEGVITRVPHSFQVLQGLGDRSLMQQWREQAAHDRSTVSGVSSLDCSRAGSSTIDDSGSEEMQPGPGVKRPNSTISVSNSALSLAD